MAESGGNTSQLQGLLDLASAGDSQARHQLIYHACRRLEALTRRMLRGYHHVPSRIISRVETPERW